MTGASVPAASASAERRAETALALSRTRSTSRSRARAQAEGALKRRARSCQRRKRKRRARTPAARRGRVHTGRGNDLRGDEATDGQGHGGGMGRHCCSTAQRPAPTGMTLRKVARPWNVEVESFTQNMNVAEAGARCPLRAPETSPICPEWAGPNRRARRGSRRLRPPRGRGGEILGIVVGSGNMLRPWIELGRDRVPEKERNREALRNHGSRLSPENATGGSARRNLGSRRGPEEVRSESARRALVGATGAVARHGGNLRRIGRDPVGPGPRARVVGRRRTHICRVFRWGNLAAPRRHGAKSRDLWRRLSTPARTTTA